MAKGLYNKYIVQKADGSPVDPDAFYLVLRLDKGEYLEACRAGAISFAHLVTDLNSELSADILQLIEDYEKGEDQDAG